MALIAAYAVGKLAPVTEPWIFTLAMLVGLLPIARRAIAAATMGTPFSIEMLMTIAAVGAVFIGATEEAAMVVLLFLIGELLEGVCPHEQTNRPRMWDALDAAIDRQRVGGELRKLSAFQARELAHVQLLAGVRLDQAHETRGDIAAQALEHGPLRQR